MLAHQVTVEVERVVETTGLDQLYSWELVETSNFAPRCSAAGAPTTQAPSARFVTVTRDKEVADDVTLFKLDTNGKFEMRHTPGQYVTLRVPAGDGGEPLTRSWTVVDNPTMLLPSYTNSQVYLAIKKPLRETPGGGASEWMHNALTSGMELECMGVEGSFSMDVMSAEGLAAIPSQLLLLSAGIGITPFVSMLLALQAVLPHMKSKIDTIEPKDVILLHTDRRLSAIPYREKLEQLAASSERWSGGTIAVRVVWALTDGVESKRLTAASIEGAAGDVSRRDVMLCGPPPFIEAMYGALGALGVPGARIATESFLA